MDQQLKKRRGYACGDSCSRNPKAIKIWHLVNQHKNSVGAKVLEIGTGSGTIADYFANNGSDTYGVDVEDSRIKKDSFIFTMVDSIELPFDDNYFDIVITNHVIEHVGTSHDQLMHLSEILRVMKPDGITYLAVPNKYRLIEPHFNLPMLSWLNQRLADIYVRTTKKGQYYDCNPPSLSELKEMLIQTGCMYEHKEYEAIRHIADNEIGGAIGRIIKLIPSFFIYSLKAFMPTFIVLIKNPSRSL